MRRFFLPVLFFGLALAQKPQVVMGERGVWR
jgi:hypothetical protein